MEIDTFRKWLAKRGCHFYTRAHEGGEGHGHLTIRREGRIAQLTLTGAHHRLDANMVRQVCQALQLDEQDLLGPKVHM